MDRLSPEVMVHLRVASWALVPAVIGLFIAWRQGLFSRPPHPQPAPAARGEDLFGIMFVYLTTQLIAVPILIHGILHSLGTSFAEVEAAGGSLHGWLQLSNTVAAATVTTLYWLLIPNHRQLWRDSRCSGSSLRDGLLAVGVWAMSYPWMIVVSQLFAAAIALQMVEEPPSQVAVQHMVSAAPHPTLRFSLILVVGFVAPLAEELLFRGTLQSWLRSWLPAGAAIGISSLILAAPSSSEYWV